MNAQKKAHLRPKFRKLLSKYPGKNLILDDES
jgi:hypothetical protein